MKKYEELADILKLGDFLDTHTKNYERVNRLLEQIRRTDSAESEQQKEELICMASSLIHTGSSLGNFRRTREALIADGIEEDAIPQIMTSASLCYLVDRTIESATAERKDNSQLQARCLDLFLDKAAIGYLGIAA